MIDKVTTQEFKQFFMMLIIFLMYQYRLVVDVDQPYMKADELQELGVEGPLTRGKTRKLKE